MQQAQRKSTQGIPTMSDAPKSSVTIKKYANRRLYNTATSSYVTLDDLAKMVKEGTEFNVYDAKSSEDITRSVLTQIIVEEEGKTEQTLLPISFLRQLIGFYGDNMQWLVPKYLEHSMQSLSKNQEQLRSYFQTAFGGMFPFGTTLEEMGKQNIAMFERAMRMFSPFGATASDGSADNTVRPSSAAKTEEHEAAAEAAFSPASNIMPMPMPVPAASQTSYQDISGDDVQNKIAALQRQLSDIAKNKG
jgi:polyhydroxyalkanoate synthesis repressor PhaR